MPASVKRLTSLGNSTDLSANYDFLLNNDGQTMPNHMDFYMVIRTETYYFGGVTDTVQTVFMNCSKEKNNPEI